MTDISTTTAAVGTQFMLPRQSPSCQSTFQGGQLLNRYSIGQTGAGFRTLPSCQGVGESLAPTARALQHLAAEVQSCERVE